MFTAGSWRTAAILGTLACAAAVGPLAQGAPAIGIRVSETAGIRRTEYPLRTRVALPQPSSIDMSQARLRLGNAVVPAQYSVVDAWPDGSPRVIEVEFNASLAPAETRLYQLDFVGGEPAPPVSRGLTVTEESEAIRIGSMVFGRPGRPLMLSAAYVRRDFIGSFDGARNGLAIVDAGGTRHDLSAAPDVGLEIVKRGPISAALRYTGKIPVGRGDSVSVRLDVEMPNSKSWIRVIASVIDPARRVRELILDTPLAMGTFPLTWDFGTVNGSYGAFRAAADAVTFRQLVDQAGRHSWSIETGTAAEPRVYETSTPGAVPDPRGLSGGWGHLIGESGAVAFGIEGLSGRPGTYTVTFDGQGQASYRLAPAGDGTLHEFVLYQHFVSTPVAIGAATSPASMLQAPVITVEP